MLNVSGIMETSLYVEDLERSSQFYRSLFNFELLFKDKRCHALNVADRQVLLLFKKGASICPVATPGGIIPSSEGGGHIHLAFSISEADVDDWEEKLLDYGIPLESRVDWKQGGYSLYFRDPDDHLIELITPGVWRNVYNRTKQEKVTYVDCVEEIEWVNEEKYSPW